MPRRIYLDFAASSPLLPVAAEKMREVLGRDLGNPSSLHAEGRALQHDVDSAREAVSRALGVQFPDLVFTCSGTEAANLAVIGAALANVGPRRVVLLSSIEHHSVLATQPILEKLGYEVRLIPCLPSGLIDLELLRRLVTEDVFLAALMEVNNETGAIQPIAQFCSLCRERSVISVVDSVQAFGNLGPDPAPMADLRIVSSHKVGGPKGVGALAVRAGVKLKPLMVGGAQEREMRAGTPNVVAIAGFGAAVSAPRTSASILALSDRLVSHVGAVRTTGAPTVSTILSLRFPGVSAESLLIRLDREGITASAGAACSSGSIEPSHVLLAMGLTQSQAKECVRFSSGPGVSEADLAEAANRIEQAVLAIRTGR